MARGWFEESQRHSEAALKGRGGQSPLERISLDPARRRAEIAKEYMVRGDVIDNKIFAEIREYKPLGVMGEIAVAMGVQPRKGVRADVPFGPYVFSEKRVPARETLARWRTQHEEADKMRKESAEYAFGLGARPNTVLGNFRVVEHARRLQSQGLLSQEEEKILQAMEKFWREHPELDKYKDTGVWKENLQIEPFK